MAHLTIVDAADRITAMSEGKKKKWVQKAVPAARRGVFKEKAERAGMSTGAYAAKEKDAPGALGKEARLAQTLMGMHKKKSRLYSHPSSSKMD